MQDHLTNEDGEPVWCELCASTYAVKLERIFPDLETPCCDSCAYQHTVLSRD